MLALLTYDAERRLKAGQTVFFSKFARGLRAAGPSSQAAGAVIAKFCVEGCPKLKPEPNCFVDLQSAQDSGDCILCTLCFVIPAVVLGALEVQI